MVRSQGAYLMDYTDCSLLVARNAVSDEAIETAFMVRVARTAKSLESGVRSLKPGAR